MANLCYTEYQFVFDSEEKSSYYCDLFQVWIDTEAKGMGKTSLFRILSGAGLTHVETDGSIHGNYPCRGEIIEIHSCENTLYIYTETAWCTMNAMWTAVFKSLNENPDMRYIAEENGCELFATNIDEVLYEYYVDIDVDNDDVYEAFGSEYACRMSEEDFVSKLRRLLNSKSRNVVELMRELESSNYIDAVWIHRYEYAPFDEV